MAASRAKSWVSVLSQRIGTFLWSSEGVGGNAEIAHEV
jgi:hypothetical protein